MTWMNEAPQPMPELRQRVQKLFPRFARDMADRILFFDGGVVAESGPPEQIFGNPQHERTKEFVRRVVSI
jgi:ABC-type histidine transport system ATPase subunit